MSARFDSSARVGASAFAFGLRRGSWQEMRWRRILGASVLLGSVALAALGGWGLLERSRGREAAVCYETKRVLCAASRLSSGTFLTGGRVDICEYPRPRLDAAFVLLDDEEPMLPWHAALLVDREKGEPLRWADFGPVISPSFRLRGAVRE